MGGADYTGYAPAPTLKAMQVVGLTGGIGSGKSTVAKIIEAYGLPVVSADELSRMVVAPGSRGLQAVVAAFGEGVLDESGALDRAKLAEIVFATPARRVQLEKIVHPRIRERFEEVLDALEKAGQERVVYEVPLLFENDLHHMMDAVIVVTAREDLRIARVCERSGLSPEEVRARIAAQLDDATRQARANYVISNNGDIGDLQREVEVMLDRFLHVPVQGRAPSLSPASPPPPPPPKRAPPR